MTFAFKSSAMVPHAEPIVHDSSHDVNPTIDVPVLIVGGGPTGLLMGYMLSELGGMLARSRTSWTSILIDGHQFIH